MSMFKTCFNPAVRKKKKFEYAKEHTLMEILKKVEVGEEFCDPKSTWEADERWSQGSSCLFTRQLMIMSISAGERSWEGLLCSFIFFISPPTLKRGGQHDWQFVG